MSRYAEALHKEDRDSAWWAASSTPVLPGEQMRRLTGTGPTMVPLPGPRDPTPERSDWLRALSALQKNWRLSMVFAISVMVAVVLMTLLTKPVYAPTARVEIDPPGAELFTMEGRAGSDSAADYMETQARNMQSDQLLISVMQRLHLEQMPEFTRQGFVSRVISGVLSGVERIPSWIWSKNETGSEVESSPDVERLSPAEASALSRMQSQLSVTRDTASRLVSVSYASHDPVLSATITNTLVHMFIEHTYQTRHAAIMESTDWLSKQLDDIRAKMEESNRALTQFQTVSGIADVDQNKNTYTEQMGELSRQKMVAQAERIQIESYLRKARESNIESLPQVQSNQVVTLLTQRLGETRAELSQTLAVYGKNHPNARKLQNQVEELESQLTLQRNAIVGQMETSYSAALSREQIISGQLRGTAKELGQMARYTALKKDAEANSDLYNALYAKVKETGIAAASKSINIRIVDEARVLESPTRPRPLVNLGIGLFVALVGGVFLAFIREALDTRVNTLEDVQRSMGISAVSMVPIAEGNGHSSMLGSLTYGLLGTSKGHAMDGPARFLLEEPGSEQSEAFHGIHTSVMLSQPGHPPRVLLVASSLPGEGKTTVAINLAVTLARQGKTCVVDADLRRPSVARGLHITEAAGLSDYLMDSVPLESVLTPAPDMENLTVLAGGKPLADPGRFINSENMRLLVHSLRQLYDFVVVDSPPLLPYADGRALAPLVDGVVFVGRAGEVTREAMSRSMELLQQVHSAPILEVVLNGASTYTRSYGYRYKYDHYTRPS